MLFFLTALMVAAVDQFTKFWIRSYPEGGVIFQAGFFRITHASNSGAAFGILQDQTFFLTVVAFAGILVILLFALLFPRHYPFLNTTAGQIVLGLILGGTAGNLIDRLRFGQVTDFINVGIWPTFNLADSAVSIGVVLFAFLFLFSNKTRTLLQSGVPD
ncbi:MAG: signal peptidase II [Chloroflexi bacterium]|nr:signal peptidase II [Chloroflexota bacterium]